MHWIGSLGIIVVAGLAMGCTPRAHLNKNTGLSLKKVLALQNSVRPQSKLAPLSAGDAKIIIANHNAGHDKSRGQRRQSSSTSFSSSSSSGSASQGLDVGPQPPRAGGRAARPD